MQVAHQNDHITHAVIGGGQAVEFGISNSAEFFNILSSTLYKDQILAVVREVLCNGWDAHIEAGCMHLPVEITLTPEKFVIRDHGKGIHHDDMGPIYGTYGNSTKKNDGKQTGGFGLGCKAPFAYTDHFEVISSHGGVRTIYNLSKSSAQAMGKPGIIPIASFPTTETGLQVSIPIHNFSDHRRFERLIRRIARNGDMNMTLNGVLLPKLGFDITQTNYLITKEDDLLDIETSIMVRYGNVIYPVDVSGEIREQYKAIENHLQSLRNYRSDGYNIVFQAPPHSISVTPSRESLSMQEHTTKTLNVLFGDFLLTLKNDFKVECDHFAEKIIDEAVTEVRVDSLLNAKPELPMVKDSVAPLHISDLKAMAERYMHINYPGGVAFRKKDITMRLTKMVAAGLLDRGLVQTFLRELEGVTSAHELARGKTEWLQRRIIAPLLAKMAQAKIDTTRLYVFDSADANAPKNYHNRDTPPLVHVKSARPTNLFNAMPYMRKLIVLSTSRSNLQERIFKHKTVKEMGAYGGMFFYQISMRKAERDAQLEFFQNSGLTVVDLTTKQDWEVHQTLIAAPRAPRKPPKKGLPTLGSIRDNKRHIETRYMLDESVKRIEKPEFVLIASTGSKELRDRVTSWDGKATQHIIDLFGDKGAVTNNSGIAQKYFKQGAVAFDDYVREKLATFMTTDPAMQEFWAYNPQRVIDEYGVDRDLVNTVYGSELLRTTYGLVNNLTDEGKKYLALWNYMMARNRHHYPEVIEKARKHLRDIPLAPANGTLVSRMKQNPLVQLIDSDGLKNLVEKHPHDSPEVKTAIEMLALAIK